MPICSLPYPVPKVQKEIFKQEVGHLVILGVLELANDSEWVAPSFVRPKPKSNQVHFLSELRNLNEQLKQKQYPIPKIYEMLLKLVFLVFHVT